jgi:hypothetical protein
VRSVALRGATAQACGLARLTTVALCGFLAVKCRHNALTEPLMRPSFAPLGQHLGNNSYSEPETIMKYANALLAKIGFHTSDDKAPDAFDLRLARIERREATHAVQQAVFKNQSTHQAA